MGFDNPDIPSYQERSCTIGTMSKSFQDNIMSSLFELDMDLPIQTIFLYLDPVSLKQSRLVCQQWANFIKKRLWGTKKDSLPYKILRKRLQYQWRHATPAVRSLQMDGEISIISCDDSIVVCCMRNGLAKVYNTDNFNFVKDLDCKPKKFFSQITSGSITEYDVQADIGKDVVATVTAKGDVSVWKRKDWSNLYKQSHHGIVEVYAVKVLSNMIITGGCDGRLAILSWNGTKVNFVRMLGEDPPIPMPTFETYNENPWHISHLDSDGEWILVGTGMSLKLWSLKTNTLAKTIKTDYTSSLVLSYPYGILAQDNEGINILNLKTGEVVHKMETNAVWYCGHYGSLLVESNRQSVTIRSFKEVIGRPSTVPAKVKKGDVWKRTKFLSSGCSGCGTFLSTSVNTSCLMTVKGSQLNIWDFWNCDLYNDLDSWAHSTS